MSHHCSWLKPSLDPEQRDETIKNLRKAITKSKLEFDAIAVRGMSGSLIGSIIAFKLKKPLIVIRKNDQSHSDFKIESTVAPDRYIIIDDFVDTGRTIETIQKAVKGMPGCKRKSCECVGIFLYRSRCRKSNTDGIPTFGTQ